MGARDINRQGLSSGQLRIIYYLEEIIEGSKILSQGGEEEESIIRANGTVKNPLCSTMRMPRKEIWSTNGE